MKKSGANDTRFLLREFALMRENHVGLRRHFFFSGRGPVGRPALRHSL